MLVYDKEGKVEIDCRGFDSDHLEFPFVIRRDGRVYAVEFCCQTNCPELVEVNPKMLALLARLGSSSAPGRGDAG